MNHTHDCDYHDKQISCRKCDNRGFERHDYYGISTGYWCQDCYESDRYSYRRDAYYDYFNAGEYLDDDY